MDNYYDLIKSGDIVRIKEEIAKLKTQSENIVKQAEQQLAHISGMTAVLQNIVDNMQKPTELVQDQE